MKIFLTYIRKSGALTLIFFTLQTASFAQGRVVINEFMPWSGCNTTSEFIELMNFGPGPMNIGCYTITNGNYAVTIPPGIILQPGQYYLISGQNILAKDCGNRDSAVTVDLNWNTCNCADKPIPTTGDGFFGNGGSTNEKVVLLDPNLNVIDAAARQLPVSSSVPITTPSLSGGCTSQTFDLSTMTIHYETIGSSTGIDNSYARKVDGDCGWVKTTDISADAPNKTGSTSSATYDFSAVNTSACDMNGGSISIQVNASDVSSLFPMSYTLAHDVDDNHTYNSSDTYVNGIDNSASTIDINNLAYGPYKITVASSMGCNLKSFNFHVFNCYTVLLPLKLVSFKYAGIESNQHKFLFRLTGVDHLKKVVLEGSDGSIYKAINTISNPNTLLENELIALTAPAGSFKNFRLRLVDKKDAVSYSDIISISTQNESSANRLWPNPINTKINIAIDWPTETIVSYTIYSTTNTIVQKGKLELKRGSNLVSLQADHIAPGIYYLLIPQNNQKQAISFRFVKQ